MNSNASEHDELTVIKGIGEAKQQWLHEANVHTLQDLAALSPDELETALAAAGRRATRSEIESWIAQAKVLAATAALIIEHVEVPGEVDSEEETTARPVDGWEAFARFVVEFQTLSVPKQEEPEPYRTVVNHVVVDNDHILQHQAWPGLQVEQLCTWILEQMREKAAMDATTEPPAMPAVSAPVQVNIIEVQVFQPPDVEMPIAFCRPNQAFQGLVNSDKPFALVVIFDLAGLGDMDAARRETRCSAQFYVRDQITGVSTHLGNSLSTALVAERRTHTARIDYASLQAGLYRLWVVVSLQGKPPIVGHLEVPSFHVI